MKKKYKQSLRFLLNMADDLGYTRYASDVNCATLAYHGDVARLRDKVDKLEDRLLKEKK